jgi:hypothetical protein
MYRATPLQTTTSFSRGSSINVIPDDTNTETGSAITTVSLESKEFSISRRDPMGVTRDRFVGIRDTVSRNSVEAAAAAAQRDEMGRGRALGSEYSWHQHAFELAVDEKLPKASGLLLLGRTPSGCDYAKNMEEEDAGTLISDASSYCAGASRMQMIHRPMPALFQDEDRDTMDLTDAENDADRNAEWSQVLPTAVPFTASALTRDDSRDESPNAKTRSSGVYQRDEQQQQQQQQEERDTSQQRIMLIPRVKSLSLSAEQDWLELEPENPPNACFCMGYSLLDFLVQDTYATSGRRQRSRTSMHRLPRSKVPLNTVEEAAEEGAADLFCIPGSTRAAPARSNSELFTTPRLMKHRKDPVGDYEDPVEIYSSLI